MLTGVGITRKIPRAPTTKSDPVGDKHTAPQTDVLWLFWVAKGEAKEVIAQTYDKAARIAEVYFCSHRAQMDHMQVSDKPARWVSDNDEANEIDAISPGKYVFSTTALY